MEQVNKINTLYRASNVIKLLYVVGMVLLCAYTSYNDSYSYYIYRIVSMVLTANVIWVFFDIFYNPVKNLSRIINDSQRSRFKL